MIDSPDIAEAVANLTKEEVESGSRRVILDTNALIDLKASSFNRSALHDDDVANR